MNEHDLIVVIRIDKDTRKPDYEFKGEWSGRWAKLAIAKMPKAYRQHMAKKLKQLELEKKVIETIELPVDIRHFGVNKTYDWSEKKPESEGVKDNGTDNRPSEPGRSIPVRRTGQQQKRSGKVKKRNAGTKTGKRTDTKGKTGIQNKPVVPETTAGTAKTTAGSTVNEQKPSPWAAAYKRSDGTDDRT